MQQHVLEKSMGFSLVNICFCISPNSRNFDLKVQLNHLTKVPIVNFNSIENNSDSDVDFRRTKAFAAASFV